MSFSSRPPAWTMCVALVDMAASSFFGWIGLKCFALHNGSPDISLFLFAVGVLNLLFAMLWLFTSIDRVRAARMQSVSNAALLFVGLVVILRHIVAQPYLSHDRCDFLTYLAAYVLFAICFLYWSAVSILVLWNHIENRFIIGDSRRLMKNKDKEIIRRALLIMAVEFSVYVTTGLFGLRSSAKQCSTRVTALLFALGAFNGVLLVLRVMSSKLGTSIANIVQPLFNVGLGLLGFLILRSYPNSARSHYSSCRLGYDPWTMAVAIIAALCQVPWGYIAHNRPSWTHFSSSRNDRLAESTQYKTLGSEAKSHLASSEYQGSSMWHFLPRAYGFSPVLISAAQTNTSPTRSHVNSSTRTRKEPTSSTFTETVRLKEKTSSGIIVREKLALKARFTEN